MYLLVLFFPLLGFLLVSLLGRFFSAKGSCFIAIFCLFLSFLSALFIFYEVCLCNSVCLIKIADWIVWGPINISWGFLFDSLTSMMLIIVTLISFLVHIYSVNYMSHDPYITRFMSYLSLFTVFMLFLVTADNLVQMFLGWEGVGLVSYLLINFWFTRNQANKAAIKALLVNRVGDFSIIIALSLIYVLFKSFNYFVIFPLVNLYLNDVFYFFNFEISAIFLISIFLFFGAVAKSAQIGLHTWLPDAMEGPTPVSALIHAATMVTAGVFLIIRMSPLIEYAPDVLFIITFFGAITAFFAATTGLFQHDLKKVIAYSTCSQLGYMVFACGLSNYNVGFFHLINHAYFKALLFLSAGAVIHSLFDEQDMRKMGGLVNLLPFTYFVMLVGSLSLMGFPFLTGFYSKDIILELSFATYTFKGFFAYYLGLISACFTSFYSFRLLYLTFFTTYNGYNKIITNVHESSLFIIFPLFILSIFSVFIGYLTKDMFIGLGTNFWGFSIFNLNIYSLNGEFMPFHIKLIPFYFSFIGAFFIYFNNYILVKYSYFKLILSFKSLYVFFIKKWYFDIIYNYFFILSFLNFGFFTFKQIDRGLIEILGPLGAVRINAMLSNIVKKISSGLLYHSFFLIIICVLFFILSLSFGNIFILYIHDLRFLFLFYFILLFF